MRDISQEEKSAIYDAFKKENLELDGESDRHLEIIKSIATTMYGETISPDPGLFDWCLEQASARYMDLLTPAQFEKLQGLGFPWEYYEDHLDKLGYHWKKNNPEGVRWKDMQ